MKPFSFLFILLMLFSSKKAFAFIDVGLGQSSVNSGRGVMSLAAEVYGTQYSLSLVSTGTQTPIYYQSNYSVSVYKNWESGPFIFGHIASGFGVGIFYGVRGFTDGTTAEASNSDVGFGPSFKVQWFFASPLFFKIEGLFGLRDLSSHLALNFQDFTTFSLGVSW
ncbi:MAG: hypothetical protein KDD50_15090 [Bdellovibrionales bacterium]|nr:hypothetical protein [Bdellovibrionales bacterium]